MLRCIDCDYTGDLFNLHIDCVSHGSFRFVAVCPMCNSRKTEVVPGTYEKDLRIATAARCRETEVYRSISLDRRN